MIVSGTVLLICFGATEVVEDMSIVLLNGSQKKQILGELSKSKEKDYK